MQGKTNFVKEISGKMRNEQRTAESSRTEQKKKKKKIERT